MKNIHFFLVGLLASTLCSAAPRGKSIGLIHISRGDVTLISAEGHEEKSKPGLEVFENDRLKSGPAATAKIVMKDRNILVLGENSDLQISQYSAGSKKQVTLTLNEGSLRNSLAQKYKKSEDHYRVVTPTAVSGVRGTDFLTEYHSDKKVNILCAFQGQVAYQARLDGKTTGPIAQVSNGQFIKQKDGAGIQVTLATQDWIDKKIKAHDLDDLKGLTVKPVPRD